MAFVEGFMIGADVRKSERVAAVLKQMPADASLKFAEAAGAFEPVRAMLIDSGDAKAFTPGRVRRSSLALIWRWLSRDVAPREAQAVVHAFANQALQLAEEGLDVSAAIAALTDAIRLRAPDLLRDDIAAAALGDPGLAHDAALVVAALGARDAFLAPLDIQKTDDVIESAEALKNAEPFALGAFACRIAAALDEPAAIFPIVKALARQRDEHRLDQTDLGEALDATAHHACAQGVDALQTEDVDARAALAVVQRRHAQARALRAEARGHVRDVWIERLATMMSARRSEVEDVARACREQIGSMLDAPRDALMFLQIDEIVACAEFLTGTANIAAELGFETARRDALGAIMRRFNAAGEDALIEDAVSVAKESALDADRFIACVDGVMAVVATPRAGAAWARRARVAIGRPAFADAVLRVLDPIAIEEPIAPVRRGLVDRAVIDAIWAWAHTQDFTPSLDDAARAFEAQRDRDGEEAHAIAAEARRNVAEAMANRIRLANVEVDDGFPAGPQLEQARAAAAMLAFDEELFTLVAEWPRRIKNLGRDELAAIRAIHDELAVKNPDIEPALLMFVMHRLERPWHVLRALDRIALTSRDTLIEATEFVAIGETLIDMAAEDAKAFDIIRDAPMYAGRVLAALERFAGVTSGMTEEFEIRRDGVWGRRLYALKTASARKLEQLCERAEAAVETVTPRSIGHGWAPIVDAPLDERDVAEASEYARFLAESKILDQRAAFAGVRARVMARVDGRLESQVDALLEIAHEGGEADRAGALAHLEALADVVMAFQGDEAASIVRRRAAAA